MSDGFLALMLQSMAALATVLALFAGLVWAVRHFQSRPFNRQENRIKVIGRLALDTKHSLLEVEHDQNRYLIGLSPTGITRIGQHVVQPDAKTSEVGRN